MQKAIITVVIPLVYSLLLLELASAKPTDHTANPESRDVIRKPGAGLPDPEIEFTNPDYADLNTPDFINTVAPDDKKIMDDVNSDKFSPLSLPPVSEESKNGVVQLGLGKPTPLPTISKPAGPKRPSSLVTNLKPDSWTASSTITSLESVSEGEDANSLVTSLDRGSGEPDNLVTTLKPGSSPTTLESDSGRRGNSGTTLMPDPHHPGNKLTNLPVTGESKNGASGIGSSCMMVSLGILLIVGSRVA